ncbi:MULTISPECIES: WS/DGAT domain-containing protein [unclassified Microcoleus]|uniref:WS/DGAT domain-containing protein n=1 Tax=unclassified Microcoleus TaxID=2642155 RepID=UPI002FD6B6E7
MSVSLSLGFPACAQDRMHLINLGTCSAVIQCVISLDDCLDERLFSESVNRVLASEPILQCQWVDSSLSPRWEQAKSDHQERFRLIQTVNLKQELDDFMSAPLDPRTDSLTQTRIFRSQDHEGAKDTLCVKISHAVSDSGGLRYFVVKLGETYAKLREDPNYHPPKTVTERSGWQVFLQLPFKQKIRLFQKGRKNFISKGQWRIPFDSQRTGGMAYVTRTLDQEQFSALSRYAKENGASLNQVMLTSYARALRRFISAELNTLLPLVNTLDLRHYLRRQGDPGVCNLSVPLLLEVVFQEGDSFEETLVQVKSKMLEQKKSVPGIFQALAMEILFLAPFYLVNKLFNKVFSEASVSGVSVPLFSDGGTANVEIPGHNLLHSYGVGPIAYPPTFMVTATTFKNTVTWAAGFCQEAISRQSIAHFFDLMVEEFPLSRNVADELGSVAKNLISQPLDS